MPTGALDRPVVSIGRSSNDRRICPLISMISRDSDNADPWPDHTQHTGDIPGTWHTAAGSEVTVTSPSKNPPLCFYMSVQQRILVAYVRKASNYDVTRSV